MNLAERNYLVVGGSSGIGEKILGRLVDAGAKVYTLSRNKPEWASHDNVKYRKHDVTNDDAGELGKFIPEILHGVVYCPGTITLKPFNRLSLDDFKHDFEVNLYGAVKVLQAALTPLRKSKDASVVLFSTVAVGTGMSFHASIAAAKAAVEGFAKSLAAEYARQNIRFNVVAPSMTRTRLAGDLLGSEEREKSSADRHPLKRIGEPDDAAAAAVYLLSPDASWVSGQVLGVDGGLGSLRPL